MSEQYLVSARKYRPQTFDTVVGQEHITTTLKNAIKNQHLAHAFLFCGPRGVGKTTCARILAKTINCANITEQTEACGVCESCMHFNDNNSFNVFEMDAASNNGVDEIRLLNDQVRVPPQTGKYKVYIIDEVHMLSASAFNAFLKTLEEPPAHAIFILATTEKHKILPTVLSRCQIFDFKRIQSQDIVAYLHKICAKEGIMAEEPGLHVIAQKSEGCMRDALSMMDRIASFTDGQLTYAQAVDQLNVLDSSFYFLLLDALMCNDVANALLSLEKVYQRGFEGDTILNGFAQHLRDLLLCKDSKLTILLDIPEAHKRQFFEKAQMVSTDYLVTALSLLNEAEVHYRNTLNRRLLVETAILKLCYLNHFYQPEAITESFKKKTEQHSTHIVEEEEVLLQPTKLVEEAEETVPLEEDQEQNPPAQEQPPVNATPSAPPTTAGTTKAALNKNFLAQLQQKAAESVVHYEPIPLTEALAKELFDAYVEELRSSSDNLTLAAQFQNIHPDCISDDEVLLHCATSMSFIYAQSHVEPMRAYFKQKTHNPAIKIGAEQQQSTEEEAPPLIKTKGELFEEMAEKNPLLKVLRDSLKLDLER